MLVGAVDLGIALLLACQETNFFESLEFALDIARVFFDQLRETADMRLKIRIFRVDNDDLATDS